MKRLYLVSAFSILTFLLAAPVFAEDNSEGQNKGICVKAPENSRMCIEFGKDNQ